MIKLRPVLTLSVFLICLCLLTTAEANALGTSISDAAAESSGPSPQKRLDLVFESFETNVPPQSWHRYGFGDSHGWSRTLSQRRTGVFSAWMQSGPAGTSQDEWLVAPLDLTGTVAPEVEWYESATDWTTNGGHHLIMASTTSPTDTTSFTVVLDMTPANHTIPGFDGEPVVVDLAAFAGEPQVWLAWRYVGSNGDDWYIDDVRVFEALDVNVRSVAMMPAEEHRQGGDVISPVATFFNDGQNAVTFDAALEILASGEVVHTETVAVTDVPVAETVDVTFTDYTLGDGHLYELRATAVTPGDGNPLNDTAASYLYTYTEPHVPLALIFTNAGCIPCAPLAQALDEYLPGMGNAAASIRVHTPWPDVVDVIYHFNPAQSDALLAEYEVMVAPTFFMDGFRGDYFPDSVVPQFEARLDRGSPSVIELAWANEPGELKVTVNNQEMVRPDLSLRLLVAITEDDIFYEGINGEVHHNQSFHGMLPDTDGSFPVSIATGRHEFNFTVDLSGTRVYENLRVTAYLQNVDTNEVMQTGTAFLTDLGTIVSGVGDVPANRMELDDCVPNPFNPNTSATFRLSETDDVELAVYALDGRRVTTLYSGVLSAGEHHVAWRGTDDAGRAVASGSYFLRLTARGASLTRPMMLVR